MRGYSTPTVTVTAEATVREAAGAVRTEPLNLVAETRVEEVCLKYRLSRDQESQSQFAICSRAGRVLSGAISEVCGAEREAVAGRAAHRLPVRACGAESIVEVVAEYLVVERIVRRHRARPGIGSVSASPGVQWRSPGRSPGENPASLRSVRAWQTRTAGRQRPTH